MGPTRINETLATLSFDYKVYPNLDKTYIISPYSENEFRNLFKEFNINDQCIEILPENYFEQYYDLTQWNHDNWYKQQAFKLCALDHFDSNYFLIQDADIILLKPYSIWISGNLNFKAERLWHEHHSMYADAVKQLTGLDRVLNYSFVSELMPYSKQDWIGLKQVLEERSGVAFLDAIAKLKEFDDTKWFSEYELLGIYKTNQTTGWQYDVVRNQMPITNWDDFYSLDWSKYDAVKFHTRPLKKMSTEEAHKVVGFLNDNY